MIQQFETFQQLGKANAEAAMKSFGTMSKAVQTAAAETADYARRSFEQGSAALEKLCGARTLDKAVEINSGFLKTAYNDFVGQTTRMGELCAATAREALLPLEGVVAKASQAAQPRP